MDIAHLTVLNPTQHSRIFMRLATTQAQAGWQVAVVGQDSTPSHYREQGVLIVPIKPYSRLAWRRLLAPWVILRQALRLKASLYHLHTPELLLTGLLLRLLTRANIAYDMHEDYALNLRYGPSLPRMLHKPAAWATRRLELLATRWLAGVTYAEACFGNLLQMPAERWVVLRNLFQPPKGFMPDAPENMQQELRLVMTGTLAVNWGLWQALALWQALNGLHPTRLVLAGFFPSSALQQQVERWIKAQPNAALVEVQAGDKSLPYSQVLHQLSRAHLSLALYKDVPQLQGRIPTKFYEAMALHRPILFTALPSWQAFNESWQVGIAAPIGATPAALAALVMEYLQADITPKLIPPLAYSWQPEGVKLVAFTKSLLATSKA